MAHRPQFRLACIRSRIAGAALAGLALAPLPAGAEQPNLYGDRETGWRPLGDDFLPPPSGPGPVTFDKRYPYVDNPTARRTRTQPTYRVADLTNPILKAWAVDEMRKANEEVMLIAQIENADGVEHAQKIAAVDGIDALWIGHIGQDAPGGFCDEIFCLHGPLP